MTSLGTADLPPLRRGRARVVAVTIVIVSSILFVVPGFMPNVEALMPTFSRPNGLVDAGLGGVGSSLGGGPSIAVGVGDTLHAVWSDGRSGIDRGIYYAQSTDNGATWILEKRIDGAGGVDNLAPSIVVDTTGGPFSGSIYVVWQKGTGTNADILFIKSIDGGISFINRYRIDTASLNVASTLPSVAVDGAGTVYVAFVDNRDGDENIYVSKSDTGGFGWTTEKRLSASADFDGYPATSALGTMAAIAWEERGSFEAKMLVSVSSDRGTTWQTNTIVARDTSLGNVLSVSVSVDGFGRLHSSWTALDQFGTYTIVYSQSSDGGATWTFPVQVNDNPALFAYYPHSSTVLFTATALYVIWTDNRNGDYDIFASWSENDGVTWGDMTPGNDIRVDDTDDNGVPADDATEQTAPSAASSQFGVCVIWADYRNGVTHHAYTASFDAGVLIVTEIRDGPNGMEEIEVYNRGSNPIDVTGWFLDIDGTSNFISPLGTIPPLQYRTIGDEVSSDMQVDITLNDEGGSVRLFDQTGTLRELVSYGQKGTVPDPIDSESVERVFANGAYSGYWTRAQSPTFKAQNLGPRPNTNSSVLINEVFYNALNPSRRFIELIYKGNGSVDITGFIIAGDTTHTFPSGVLDGFSNYVIVFPTQTPALFSAMGATGDNLYLYDTAGKLLDMVGWTSAHTQDRSMCRIPDGFGFSEGFDDPSSTRSGWVFDCVSSPHLIGVGPPSTILANIGDIVDHEVFVANFMSTPTLVDLKWDPPPSDWAISLLASDHITPLTDSNLNSWPDVSLDSYGAPNQTVNIVVRVSTPSSTPSIDSLTTLLTAEAQPEGLDSVKLVTGFYPFLSINRSANPTAIYVKGTGYAEETTITLDLRGRGMTIPGRGPDALDVVFVIDDTGSMGTWIGAVKSDVDKIAGSLQANVTDVRYGLVSFKDVPLIDVDQDLTSSIALFKTALFALTASGGGDTPEDPDAALETAANLSWRLGSIPKVMVLVTDAPAHDDVHLAMVARWAYNVLNIHTNAIGCGSDINMVNDLTATALEGHGYFIQLGNPNLVADAIISGIMAVLPPIDYAAQDRDLSDANPMVRDALPPYIAYVPGTFMDPVTKAAKPPSFVATDGSGNTILEWNVSVLKINTTWSVQFNVTSSLTGLVVTNVLGMSRVSFVNWSGYNITLDFPLVWITVLPSPPLPDLAISSTDIVPFPPAPYLEGYQLFLNTTVHNFGLNTSGATIVRFYDGIPPAPTIDADQPLASIPMSATGQVSVIWTPMVAGFHDVCVVVDPANAVREMDESNNLACLSIFVRPTKPDYVPHLPDPPANIRIGLSLTLNLSIMVMNQGNRTAAGASTLAFRNQTGGPFQYVTVPAISALGESIRHTVRWTSPPNPGVFLVLAVVDYNNSIDEWNESNNEFTWAVQVVKGPITNLIIGSPNHTASKTFIRSTTPLNLTVEDRSGTGIRSVMYKIDDGQWRNTTPGSDFFISGEGNHTIRWYSEDFAGNKEAESNRTVVVDDTPPTSSLTVGNPKHEAAETWVTSITTMSLLSSDGGLVPAGLKSKFYRTWNGTWSPWLLYGSLFSFSGKDGPRRIEYYSEDWLGNAEATRGITIFVDNTPPTMTLVPYGHTFAIDTEFSLVADDGNGCGVSSIWVSLDDGTYDLYMGPFSLGLGQHRVVYKSMDMLGNPTESSKLVEIVEIETLSLPVSFNYKPAIAFVFSLILMFTAILSAHKRQLRFGRNLRRRLALSLAILPSPFLIAEGITGALSMSHEFLRIPPFVGWGMAIDSIVLIVGILFLVLRFLIRRKGETGKGAEEGNAAIAVEDVPPPPPED